MSADDSAEKKLTSVLMHATNAAATHELLSEFKREYGADVLRAAADRFDEFDRKESGDILRKMADDVSKQGNPLCRCDHPESDHQGEEGLGGAQCRVCPEDGERSWLHPFTPRGA